LAPSARFFGTHSRTIEAGPFICTLSRATVPKERVPEHQHDDGHFILAVDPGYLSRAFDAEEFGRGLDLVYNPPGTAHRDCFHEPSGRFLSLAVPSAISPQASAPRRVSSAPAEAMMRQVLGICARRDIVDALYLEDCLFRLLASIEERAVVSRSPQWLTRADELIAARATEHGVTIAALAQELDLHPVYLARAYAAVRGPGPAVAILHRRIAAAAAMISRDHGLAEIAAECGFADQSHLCRSMQKLFGISPGQFRLAFA
jgi:AraC family transcriptional regulator